MADPAREALGLARADHTVLSGCALGRREKALLAALLGALAMVALARPLLPVDETRYAAVAWEMWQRGDFLVPHLNGEPYPHKPPLLFWLIHAGWMLFGIHAWWPRLISPLFAAGTLALAARIAQALWPQRTEVACAAPFVLLATPPYAYLASALMFDAGLTFFYALGLAGLVVAWRTRAARGFGLLALGLGGGLLIKGPVGLVHLLPLALAAPWWVREPMPWRRWYGGVVLAVLGSAALTLAWAVPAGLAAGPAFREAIFWRQSAGRMVESFAHVEPWWFYLVALPLTLAPWVLWPRLWRSVGRSLLGEPGVRLALLGMLAGLGFFSAISGKRWQYLLPEHLLFALLAARALSGAGVPVTRVLRLAAATVMVVAVVLVAIDLTMRERFDTAPVAALLARYEREGRPVAITQHYHGQWTFAGRLSRPLEELDETDVPAWLAAHPDGRVIVIRQSPAPVRGPWRVEMHSRWRGGWLVIVAPS